ncbi:hypothetical protein B0H19DRAFT_1273293 [Mycena capillaripes]|nr:hypothetical protein B0H19DRAFT_1273293 [Mycena capillaripes]
MLVGGVVTFAVFSIHWGSAWSTPNHTLPGWIVVNFQHVALVALAEYVSRDFDGGAVGHAVSTALSGLNPGTNGGTWQLVSASQFPEGISQLQTAIVQEKTWYAVMINSRSSANLSAAVSAVDGSYNSSMAITFMASEARNKNIYRAHSRMKHLLVIACRDPAIHCAAVVARPIYYTTDNLRPFDVAVYTVSYYTSAIAFAGLIYLLILAASAIFNFFIVKISTAAREASGLETRLTLGSLVCVRIATSSVAYFFISVCTLSTPLQEFDSAGFVIFWILTWMGMLAYGLALESMATLLGARFTPFFLTFG